MSGYIFIFNCFNLEFLLKLNLSLFSVVLRISRKYPYLPRGGSVEIPRDLGVRKPKILKESMKQNWNFQRGGGGGKGGSNLKSPLWEEYGCLPEQHISFYIAHSI